VTGNNKPATEGVKGRYNIIFTTLLSESRNTDSKTEDYWKHDLSDIQNVDKTSQFFKQKCSQSLTFYVTSCHEGT
jgi:hypothetical protein